MIKHIRRLWHKGCTLFSNLTMQRKLIIVFVFLISLPITFVSYMSYRSSLGSAIDSAIFNANQMTANATDKMDRYIADLKRYTTLPLYNQNVQANLEQQAMDWDKRLNINMFLAYLINAKEELTAVYLIDHYGAVYYNKKPDLREIYPEERVSAWQAAANKADVAPVLLGTHTIRVNDHEQRQVFTVLRNIQSVSTLHTIGLIAFDVDTELLAEITQPLESVTQGSSLIIDQQGQVVYDRASSKLGLNPREVVQLPAIAGKTGQFKLSVNGAPYIAVYTTSKETGWTTLVYIPLNKLMAPLQHNRNILILRTLSILAFALFVAMVIAHALTHPLKRTVQLMKKVQSGNLDVRVKVKYNDEIGMLGSHFNRMIGRIKDLVEEVHETEKRKQKADIRALQNQINPHFIYNTLESIRMLAEINDDEQVAELTYLLGLLLRYGIVRGEETVTVREELEHVRNYVHLLGIRFPGKFRLEIHVPEDIQSISLIKLIFQPIVENSIFHGLEKREGSGTVRITGHMEETRAVFVIQDDGAGMEEATLRSLRSSLESGTADKFGIGLRNVHERLRLNYGVASGLTVESKPGEGTRVILTFDTRPQQEGGQILASNSNR